MLAHRLILAALLLAGSVSAELLEVLPVSPTTATPVAISITEPGGTVCPSAGSVTRNGASIRININGVKPMFCPPVPGFRHTRFELGTLPAGEYSVAAFVGGFPEPLGETKFVVRNADSKIRLVPFANVSRPAGPQVDRGATVVIEGLSPTGFLCPGELCSSVKVYFGDVAVPARVEGGRFVVNAPPRPPGLFDVKIVARNPEETYGTIAGGAYFYDRGAAPDLSVWSRVLFPVLESSAGAFGAQWVTDAVIDNANDSVVENFNRVDPRQCFDVGCERVAAHEYLKFEGRRHPRGAVLLTPHESVDGLTFASRVRDRSREGEDFGTEIPVVRESGMFRARFRLLDIPISTAYRAKLRVYAYLPVDGQEVAITGSSESRVQLFQKRVPLTRVDASLVYAEVDLDAVPEAKNVGRLILDIQPPLDVPAWAFVTVTNNTTQRVTLVTPN